MSALFGDSTLSPVAVSFIRASIENLRGFTLLPSTTKPYVLKIVWWSCRAFFSNRLRLPNC